MTPGRAGLGRIGADLAAPPLVLLPPLVNFLKFNDYGLWRPESLLCAAALALGGLALGAVLATGNRPVRAIVVGLLAVLFVDLQLDWFGWEAKSHIAGIAKLALVAWLAGSALGWLLHRHVTEIVAAAGVTILAATIVWPAAERPQAAAKGAAADTPAADLPPIVHLVLDELIAPEGLPRDLPGGAELRDELIRFYRSWGFRLWGRAYSHYFGTHNSIPNLINFDLAPVDARYVDRNPYVGAAAEPIKVEENAYFRRLIERGYRIRVYQSDFMDYCATPGIEVASCTSYPIRNIKILEGLALPPGQKARVMLSKLLQLSEFHDLLRATYRVAQYLLAKADLIRLPPWTLDMLYLPPAQSLTALDRLGDDLIAAPRGHAYFAHLFLPHFPYAYDAECGLRQSATSWKLRFDRRALAPFANTPQSRAEAYALYFQQVACLHRALDRLFERQRAAGVYEDAVIIVHGDHGSRLGLINPYTEQLGLLGPRDFVDHFATLFAAKAKGFAPGYDLDQRSIQELFTRLAGGEPERGAREPPGSPFVFIRGRPFEALARHPMPAFGPEPAEAH